MNRKLWRKFAAVGLASAVAFGCTVTSSDDSDDDGFAGAGGSGGSGGSGTAGSGGSGATGGSGGTAGSGGSGGSAGTAGGGGSSMITEMEACDTMDPAGQNECEVCIRNNCCTAWTACLNDEACSELGGDRIGGGANGDEPDMVPDGEFFCFQDCVLDAIEEDPTQDVVDVNANCASECSETALVSEATNDLISCVVDMDSMVVCESMDGISLVCLNQ